MTKPPAWPRLLGFLGLLPQLAAALMVLSHDPAMVYHGLSLAFAYAALIFSFLGGCWWGLAAAAGRAAPGPYLVGVAPSLFALAAALPWMLGWTWPQPSLVLLGLAIAFSPLVDRALVHGGTAPAWWMALRLPLSLGLGALTLLMGLVRLPVVA